MDTILMTKVDLAREIGSIKEIFADLKASIIKWMFFFWVLQLIATFGFLLLIFK